MEIQKPTIGRIVIYRTDGRNGLSYDLPANITCTQDTHPGDYPDGRRNPLPVPMSPSHVHLTVLTPGGFGTELVVNRDIEGEHEAEEERVVSAPQDEDFPGALLLTPGSGSYVEWNVPFYAPPAGNSNSAHEAERAKRTWRYPDMVRTTITV